MQAGCRGQGERAAPSTTATCAISIASRAGCGGRSRLRQRRGSCAHADDRRLQSSELFVNVNAVSTGASASTYVPADGHEDETGERRVGRSGILLVASFGALLAFLDATIVNVAFPSIQESFSRSSIGSLSWVLNSYNIVFASFLVAAGRYADVFGRRRVFTSGVVTFTSASESLGGANIPPTS